MHPVFALIERRLFDLGKEVGHLEQALRTALEDRLFDGRLSWLALSGLSAGTSAIYSGIERILTGIMENIDGWTPSGSRSHQDILDAASIRTERRPPIVSERLYEKLVEMKAFRHFDRHNYRFVMDVGKTVAAAKLAVETSRIFVTEVTGFLREFDDTPIHDDSDTNPHM